MLERLARSGESNASMMPTWFTVWTDGVVLAASVTALLAALALATLRAERLRVARLLAVSLVAFGAVVALGRLTGESESAAARIASVAATFVAGVCMIQIAAIVVLRLALPRFGLAPARILEEVLSVAAVVVWALVLLHRMGVDATSIFTTSALLTAVVGLALQDTLGNVLGGLALQTDRSVGVGDWVAVDGTAGRVVEVTWRHTSIETNNWETMVVPNSYLVRNRFVVLGRYRDRPVQHRRSIPFYVDADQRPDEVIEAVEISLRRLDLEGVATDPRPECHLIELAESPVRYAVSYWLTNLGSPNPTDSAVRVQIHLALGRAGIEVAVPSREVRLHEESDDERDALDRAEIARRVGALRGVALFEVLDEPELAALAERLVPAPYLVGDVLVRQGGESRRLYVIVDGRAEVYVESPSSGRAKVSALAAGDFFGEMGVMTGEPRTATVVAATPMLTYRLDRESFRHLLARRPDLADHFAEVLASRRAELDHTLEGLDAEAGARRVAAKRQALRATIRQFFGLGDARTHSAS